MASPLPRGVSENKDSSARHSLRTAACSAATKRTADSLLSGHDISVFWFSSEIERTSSGETSHRCRQSPYMSCSKNKKQTALALKSIKVSGCRFVSKKHRQKLSDTSPQPSVILHSLHCQMLKAQSEVLRPRWFVLKVRGSFSLFFLLSSTASLSSSPNHNPLVSFRRLLVRCQTRKLFSFTLCNLRHFLSGEIKQCAGLHP